MRCCQDKEKKKDVPRNLSNAEKMNIDIRCRVGPRDKKPKKQTNQKKKQKRKGTIFYQASVGVGGHTYLSRNEPVFLWQVGKQEELWNEGGRPCIECFFMSFSCIRSVVTESMKLSGHRSVKLSTVDMNRLKLPSDTGPNPIQFSSAGATVPMAHALHPVVGRQSQRLPQYMRTFVSLSWSCIMAA